MKEILTSIRRTPYQSLSSFLILFFTLFLSLFFFNLTSFFNGILSYVETRPQVTVYFKDTTSQEDIFKLRDEISSTGKTLSIKYVSKEEALKIYKELNKNNPLLLEMVTADILPASLEIYASKPEYLSQIAEFLKKQPGIDEVIYQKSIVDKLISLTSVLRQASIFILLFLLVISVIVLMTTTAFKIAMKKDEIELLRLLGASNFYIKKPFLLEAILFGLTASVGSFVIILSILFYLKPFFTSYLKDISQLTLSIFVYKLTVWPLNLTFLSLAFSLSLLFGVGIAIFATLLATQKYLKI